MKYKKDNGLLLFELIKKLSAREKVHFIRQHRAQKRDSMRISLYRRMEGMKAYDRDALKDYCRKHQINWYSTSLGLLEAINKSLAHFHSQSSTKLQLNELLSQIEILHKKGLLDLSRRYIEKGIQQADKHQLVSYSLLFRNWRYIHFFLKKSSQPELEEIEREEEELLYYIEEQKKMLSIYHHTYLTDRIMSEFGLNYLRSCKLIEEKILAKPLFEPDQEPKSVQVLFSYFDLISSIYYYLEDWPSCSDYTLKFYRFLKENSTPASTRFYKKCILLTNLMLICNYLEDRDNFQVYEKEFLEVVRQSKGSQDEDLIRKVCVSRWYLHKMHHAQLSGQYEEGHQIVEQHLLQMMDDFDEEDIYIKIYAEIIAFYFKSGEYDICSRYIHKLSQIRNYRAYFEIYYFVSWMELLCYYKLLEESLFQSKWHSLHSYLKDKRSPHVEWEKQVLTLLMKTYGLGATKKRDFVASINTGIDMFSHGIKLSTKLIDLPGWLSREFELHTVRL